MQENQGSSNDEQNRQNLNADGEALDYEAVSELLPIFVMGALEPAEMIAVEDYVLKHQALLDRLVDLEATTAQLAYAAPYAPLPTQAKQRLLQRAQADVLARSGHTGVSPVLFPARPRPVQSAKPLPSMTLRPKPRNWFGTTTRLVAAGVAAALILAVLSAVQLRNTATQLAAELATARTQLTQAQRQNLDLQTTVQALQQQAAQLAAAQTQLAQLRSQNAQLQTVNQTLQQQLQSRFTQIAVLTGAQRQVALAGTQAAPTATGRFYIQDNNTGVLVLNGLQPLAANQAYQLWFIPAQGAPRPSGVVQVTNTTPNTLLVTIPAQDQNFAVLGVTIEPASGSPAPTGNLVLRS